MTSWFGPELATGGVDLVAPVRPDGGVHPEITEQVAEGGDPFGR